MKRVLSTLAACAATLLSMPSASAATAYSAPLRTAVRQLPMAAENTSQYDGDRYFGQWIDANGDCQNTRHEVLITEGTNVALSSSRCTVSSGTWRSFYDNRTYNAPSQVQIDHLIPLSEAWDSGAQRWTQARRVSFTNDLGVGYALNNINGSLNQAKADYGPEQWMPPANKCRYGPLLAHGVDLDALDVSVGSENGRPGASRSLLRLAARSLPGVRRDSR